MMYGERSDFSGLQDFPKRGELWWADFGDPFGSEPGYRRPALILQNDLFNSSKLRTAIVIPLTTNLELGEMPGNIFLKKTDSRLPKDSVLLLSQIDVIDKARLRERISKINNNIMKKVENGILLVLGIER